MAKNKPTQLRPDPRPAPAIESTPAPGGSFVVFRETVESIVVAFVLAFLFRTYEAEAFVIPTGSMSPALLGQHKDVACPECGYSFRTTASSEGEDWDKMIARHKQTVRSLEQAEARLADATKSLGPENLRTQQLEYDRNQVAKIVAEEKRQIDGYEVVGGMCPMCRYLMPMRSDLPENVAGQVDASKVKAQPSYPGDRILVNKYGFDFSDPQRWDVVVFKFPGDGNMNYIKRLVGLPGETLQVYQGDIFTRPDENQKGSTFRIERKPPDKVAAMLQPVHDTDFESATLNRAGWPLRWAATTPNGWKIEVEPGEHSVQQQYSVDLSAEAPEAWLRYRHIIPDEGSWRAAHAYGDDASFARFAHQGGSAGVTREQWKKEWKNHLHPQLITDFNPYNARLLRSYAKQDGWEIGKTFGMNAGSVGTEWVSDLALECDVKVQEPRGELMLDLVEAGNHFRATVNLQDGKASLSIVDGRTDQPLSFKATGQTALSTTGSYKLRFANVDDRLLLWVDGKLVDCGDATYDPDKLFEGGRAGMIPWASEAAEGDQGDLAPAGVGAKGAKLEVTRLAVLRDIYYIATQYPGDGQHFTDYDLPPPPLQPLFEQPGLWQQFATRQRREFPIESGQLFVMGDNSPESKDCRLWMMRDANGGVPGGHYLDRRLLIGKAICVFWPHSWGSIPGLPMLPGFPNFSDMRLVR